MDFYINGQKFIHEGYIGGGTSSKVYKVRDEYGGLYAAKVSIDEWEEGEDVPDNTYIYINLLSDEAQHLQLVNGCPNIVSYYSSALVSTRNLPQAMQNKIGDYTMVIILEYIQGVPLSQLGMQDGCLLLDNLVSAGLALQNKEIYAPDLHDDNVLFNMNTKQFVRIDLGEAISADSQSSQCSATNIARLVLKKISSDNIYRPLLEEVIHNKLNLEELRNRLR